MFNFVYECYLLIIIFNFSTLSILLIVGELLKYGGFGMVDLFEQLFSVIWQEEIVPRQWREGQYI